MVLSLILAAFAADRPYHFNVLSDGSTQVEAVSRILDIYADHFVGCMVSTDHFDARYGLVATLTVRDGKLVGDVVGEISPGVENPFTPPAVQACFTGRAAMIVFPPFNDATTVHFVYAP